MNRDNDRLFFSNRLVRQQLFILFTCALIHVSKKKKIAREQVNDAQCDWKSLIYHLHDLCLNFVLFLRIKMNRL